jgi:hypothetical protein
MRLIQVIFGKHGESDFQCGRCGGTGIEPQCDPAANLAACYFCGDRPLPLPRAYTYALPHDLGVKLWDHVWVPPSLSSAFPQLATVVALTSDYRGEVKTIIPYSSGIPGAPARLTAS